jgi:hypothetical protein
LNIEASGVCCSNMGVKDRQTKQILYELDFTVDELLFYDLKHYVELPCSVHAISYVFFSLSLVILECYLPGRR